ncbi:uncharacterized protein LOC123662839 [Melitaea cinxia]|uniref:uncharacterized protein LOC123662839 n=1 Tax=Melitaea cinxia TaxID=113334 RepID=UPI001E2711F8|nr:uncharacterized protein LOC123662839 [Melitaea cinxia]
MRYQFECEFQNTPVATKAKKKARNPAAWKQNKRKALKNTGQEHTNSSGKVIPAKKMGPPCTEKCLFSCSKRISIEDRQKLFAGYWELGCLTRQRDYIASCITTLASDYRRLKTNPKFARKPNSCFHLPINGDKVRVCKTFLLSTLAITPRYLRHIIDKRTATGTVPPDRRGTLTKKRIDTEIHESVRSHINSIPRIESHYLRAQTTRQYIDGQYTVAELHRLYCEDRKANDKPCASYDFYNRVFNHEFNLSFFTPKKDQCDQCVSYHNLSKPEQWKKEVEYKLHLKEKTLSREEKDADMKLLKELGHNNLIVAIYDLQAVLPVPIGNSSAFFYKSKLNCYNFTVTDFKEKKTSCFFWHEGLGNRGVNEIGSCVYIFLEELAQKHPNCDVIFYSDNCCGQQKNK